MLASLYLSFYRSFCFFFGIGNLKSVLRVFLPLLTLFFGFNPGVSAQPGNPDFEFNYKNIGRKVSYFEDKTAALDLAQVKSIDSSGLFVQGKEDILNFGNHQSAFWIKVNIAPQGKDQTYVIVDAPNIEHLDFFANRANGSLLHVKSGSLLPGEHGVDITNNFVFSLPEQKCGVENTIYLRLKTNNILFVPLKLATADAIMKGKSYKDRIEYIYAGILIALLLFNLFLYTSLKDRTYLYYTIYVFTMSLYHLLYIRGYGYLLGDELRVLINLYPHVILSISVLSSLMFCRMFLNLDKTVPEMLKLYYAFGVAAVLLFFSSALGYKSMSALIAQVLTVSSALVVWISGIIAYRRGHKPAKYYIVAWFFIMLTVGIVTISLGGILKANEFTMLLVPLGSSIELILLSFALGDRFNSLIKAEQAARDENLVLVKTQNQRLEVSVKERTAELSKLFSIIAHDLRSPLNSLMSILTLNEIEALTMEDIQYMLSENKKNIEGIQNTLDNLLHWARSQMNGIKTEPSHFDLKVLLDELMLVYLPLMEKKQISLETYTEGIVLVYADVNQVRLILRNLIDNAIKFTPKGEKITLMLKRIAQEVEVCVSNTVADPSRINTEDLMGVNMIEATYGTENEKGVGLGLHLCREYIRSNGGELRIQLEQRTILFCFELPV